MDVKRGLEVVVEGRAAKVLVVHADKLKVFLSIAGTQEKCWAKLEQLEPFDAGVAAKPVLLDIHSTDDASELVAGSELGNAVAWTEQFATHGTNGFLSPSDLAAIAVAMSTSVRTVRRRYVTYINDPTPLAQVRSRPGPKAGSSYFSEAMEALIKEAIENKYESKERASIAATATEAKRLCRNAGLKEPSEYAVYVRIQKRDRWHAARRRHGRVRGDATQGPAGPRQDVGYKPLDFIQIDHAIVDVIVVDEETREEIGRPWLTLAVDVASRCVPGFYLTLDDPGQTSVALALENCIFPKDQWLAEQGIDIEWLPMGLMKCVGWDNAKCFRVAALRNALEAVGVKVRYRKVKTPKHGAHIERLIGTVMGKAHLLRGTTFSNTKQREDYRSGERACMTLKELLRWLILQIHIYHHTEHKGLKRRKPIHVWQESRLATGEYRVPRYPADRRSFLLSLLPGTMRRVGREGVSRFAESYWDDALIPLINANNKFWTAHDPRNISKVFVLNADQWIDVPWRDRTQRPCALFELKFAKKRAKAVGDDPADRAVVHRHLNEIANLEATAVKTTREQRRRNARRPRTDPDLYETVAGAPDYSQPCELLSEWG